MTAPGGAYAAFRPELHPRDSHGRFRDKWGLPAAAKKLVDGIVDAFKPMTGRSDDDLQAKVDAHAAKQKRTPKQKAALDRFTSNGFAPVQADLRAGKPNADAKEMDSMLEPLPEDMFLTRVVGPEAFGLPPQRISEVEEWTGKLVADKGFAPTNAGTPLQVAGPHVTLSIMTPKGTPAIIPGGSREVILGRDQPLRIVKVDSDGRGGVYVYAVAQPSGRTRALGRGMRASEKAPAIEATPEELKKRGLQEPSPAVAGVPSTPGAIPSGTGAPQGTPEAPAQATPEAGAPDAKIANREAKVADREAKVAEREAEVAKLRAAKAAGNATAIASPAIGDSVHISNRRGQSGRETWKITKINPDGTVNLENRDSGGQVRKKEDVDANSLRTATPIPGTPTAPTTAAQRAKRQQTLAHMLAAGPSNPTGTAPDNLDKSTVVALRAIAKKDGIKLLSRDRKADIIAKIRKERGSSAQLPPVTVHGPAKKVNAPATPSTPVPNPAAAANAAKRAAAREHADRIAEADGAHKLALDLEDIAFKRRDSTYSAKDRADLVKLVEQRAKSRIGDPDNERDKEAQGYKKFADELGDPAKLDTPEKLQRKVRSLLKKRGLSVDAESGAVKKYDPDAMDGPKDLKPGDDVHVVVPGISYTDKKTGEKVVLSRPKVARKVQANPTKHRKALEEEIENLGRHKPVNVLPLERAAQSLANGESKKEVAAQLHQDALGLPDKSDRDTYGYLSDSIAKDLLSPPAPSWIGPDGNLRLDTLVQAKGVDVAALKHKAKRDPVLGPNPWDYLFDGYMSDLASGMSVAAMVKQIRTQERQVRAAGQSAIDRKKKNGNLLYWEQEELNHFEAVADALKRLGDVLEPQRGSTPRVRPTAGTGRIVLGGPLPIDDSRFKQVNLHDVITHRGVPVDPAFSHPYQPFQMGAGAPRRPGLTDAENKALDFYTSGSIARAINDSLRSGQRAHGKFDNSAVPAIPAIDLDDLQHDLDTAIQNSELTEDAVLWRGVFLPDADRQRLVPGAVMREPAYTSTTTDRVHADSVLGFWKQKGLYKDGKPAYFKILAPKGTRGAIGMEGLKEVLLPRDQKYRVVREEEHDGSPVFVLEIVTAKTDAGLVRGRNRTHTADYARITTMPTGFGMGSADEQFGEIARLQGFDGAPRVVSSEELDRAIRRGATQLHRGIKPYKGTYDSTTGSYVGALTPEDMAEQFRSGKLFPGQGLYGAGTYTTPDRKAASSYAGTNGILLRMALRPDARVISHEDIVALHKKFSRSYVSRLAEAEKAELAATTDPATIRSITKKYNKLRASHQAGSVSVMSNIGRYAALLGYDVIHVGKKSMGGGFHEYVILNRTALLIEEPKKKKVP
jgi:ADP-ribosyltransferase exoenzyme